MLGASRVNRRPRRIDEPSRVAANPSGTNENDSSPAANNPTSRFASRRSVFTRSPGAFGIDPGETTRRSSPRATASRASANHCRPRLIHRAHRPSEPLQKHRDDIARRAAQPLDPQLPRHRIKDRRNRLALVHIKPDESNTFQHGRHLP